MTTRLKNLSHGWLKRQQSLEKLRGNPSHLEAVIGLPVPGALRQDEGNVRAEGRKLARLPEPLLGPLVAVPGEGGLVPVQAEKGEKLENGPGVGEVEQAQLLRLYAPGHVPKVVHDVPDEHAGRPVVDGIAVPVDPVVLEILPDEKPNNALERNARNFCPEKFTLRQTELETIDGTSVVNVS